jgi:uncharacterized phage protein (TIGR02218 family)
MGFHKGISEFVTIYSGRVLGINHQENEAIIKTESLTTVILKAVLQRYYQVQCPHVLYGQGRGKCNVDKTAFMQTVNLAGVSGSTLTGSAFASKPDGYFSGGWIDYAPSGDELQRRFIRSHVGGNVIVDRSFIEMPGGATVIAYPGCDHMLEGDCKTTFNNTINNGGFPYMPLLNPFTTSIG